MKAKILFICQCNLNRSPTFENYFKKIKDYDVRSAGILFGYPHIVTKKLLDWADKVYVMDLNQAIYLSKKFNFHNYEIIGISDEYHPNDRDLIEIIEFWFKERKKGNIVA